MESDVALQRQPRTSQIPATVSPPCLVSIIVPTYREVENLPLLVPRLADALAHAGLTGEVLIVDDNSQDGTEMLCKELATSYPVRLIVRASERGLAGAVLRGLHEAHGEILVVMDADLSHPPEKVPELVQLIQQGTVDFVIGSRYAVGGRIDARWSWLRRLNSNLATWLARPLTATRDPLAGFFALPRAIYERGSNRLRPVGYKIGLELLVKCECRQVQEVPIDFSDRTKGASKLNVKEQWNYLRHLLRLYSYRLRKRFFAE